MISYLNEQPRTQALADALRGTAASSGGTQMPAATPMPGSSLTPPPPPDFNQYGNGAEGGGADLGDALKSGFDAFKNSGTGKNMMSSMSSIFGGSSGADIGRAADIYGPEVAKMGGNVGVTSGGTATTGGGMMSSLGPIAAAIAGGLATDNLLNESDKDKWYNADKLNSYGTVNMGGKDIGLRGGDLVNGLNPATWLSDPNKAQKGLLNAFTLGIFD